jgi:hypothetical protein
MIVVVVVVMVVIVMMASQYAHSALTQALSPWMKELHTKKHL